MINVSNELINKAKINVNKRIFVMDTPYDINLDEYRVDIVHDIPEGIYIIYNDKLYRNGYVVVIVQNWTNTGPRFVDDYRTDLMDYDYCGND